MIVASNWFDALRIATYTLTPELRGEQLVLRGGAAQTVSEPIVAWRGRITLVGDGWDGGRDSEALLDMALRGRIVEARPPWPHPTHDPEGTAAALHAPTVGAVSADGWTLTISGAGPEYRLARGDFLSIDWTGLGGRVNRLYRVGTDAQADATGTIAVEVSPRLDAAAPVGAAVEIGAPVYLALLDWTKTGFGSRAAGRYTAGSLELIQVLDEVTT